MPVGDLNYQRVTAPSEIADEGLWHVLHNAEFMRGRRPYLFSDSTDVEEAAVSREVLSHHLETLTKPKDEVPF
jgi:hypothetical protein